MDGRLSAEEPAGQYDHAGDVAAGADHPVGLEFAHQLLGGPEGLQVDAHGLEDVCRAFALDAHGGDGREVELVLARDAFFQAAVGADEEDFNLGVAGSQGFRNGNGRHDVAAGAAGC